MSIRSCDKKVENCFHLIKDKFVTNGRCLTMFMPLLHVTKFAAASNKSNHINNMIRTTEVLDS